MSRNRKNNHYHYAEKFEDRSRRSRRPIVAITPILFMILVLLGFGCISTTFSIYVSTMETPVPKSGGLHVAVNNNRVDNPLADKEAVGDEAPERNVAPTEAPAFFTELTKQIPVTHISKTDNPTETIDPNAFSETVAPRRDADLAETGWSNSEILGQFLDSSNWNSETINGSGVGYFKVTNTSGKCLIKADNTYYGYGPSSWNTPSINGAGTYNAHNDNGTKYDLDFSLSAGVWKIQLNNGGGTNNYINYTLSTVNALSSSITLSKTSITTSQTATVGHGTTTGGSGSYNYDYTVKNSSNVDVTASVLNGTTFSASTAGTYTVTCTVSDANISSSVLSSVSYSKTITVTNPLNPAVSSVSLSQYPSSGTIYSKETSVTYTATIGTQYASSLTYTFYVDGVQKQSSSSATYGPVVYDTADSYSVTVTVSATGYDSKTSSAVSTTVVDRPSMFFKYGQTSENMDGYSGEQMTYDPTATSTVGGDAAVYKYSLTLTAPNWYYITIYDSAEGHNLSYNGGDLTETFLLTSDGFNIYDGSNNLNNPLHVAATATGQYNFYYDATGNRLFVEFPHTVTFDMKSHGTQVNSQVITYGGKVTQPAAPTASGYTFGGWYKESGCTNQWNFSTDTVTQDKTLYAKWTANGYTVTLNQNYNNCPQNTTVNATYGSALPSITPPTRTGYTFQGYYTASTGGTPYYNSSGLGSTWNIAESRMLYAHWNTVSYKITLTRNGGTYASGTTGWTSTTNTYTQNYTIESSTITLPTLTKTGYTFVGWYLDSDTSHVTRITSVPAGSTGNKAYTAYFTKDSYLVKLIQSVDGANPHANIDAGWRTDDTANVADGNNVKTTLNYNIDSAAITLPTASDFDTKPTVGGVEYLFSGWYADDGFNGDPVTEIAAGSNGNKTYYAKWTPPIKVHFINDVTGQEIVHQVAEGTSVASADVPTFGNLDGFTKSGWDVNNAWQNVTQETYVYYLYIINKPTISVTLSATPASEHQGSYNGATQSTPYIVEYGASLTANGSTSTSYTTSSGAVIRYKWKVNDQEFEPIQGATGVTYTKALETTKTNVTSPYYNIKVNLTVSYKSYKNSAGGTDSYMDSNPADAIGYYSYYGVESPVRTFELNPFQRIYQSSTVNTSPVAQLIAKISSRVPENYRVVLKSFSGVDGDPYSIEVTGVDTTHTGQNPNFTVDSQDIKLMAHTFNNSAFNSFINNQGVKSLRFNVSYPNDSTPPVYTVDSVSDPIKNITVGTKNTIATRPIFLKLNSQPTGRIMMYYNSANGEIQYQTGNAVSTILYRFNLPANISNVYFVDAKIEDDDHNPVEYVTPSVLANLGDYCDDGYYLAASTVYNIPAGTQTISATLNETDHTINGFESTAI